jgi:hypothetical protein
MLDKSWRSAVQFLSVCANGCYKHFVKGKGWVCCQCGK